MPKSNPLSQALNTQQQPRGRKKAAESLLPTQKQGSPAPPSRNGRVLIAAHFAPEVQRALKIIAAEEGTTMQALLAEGINGVFAKRHKPEIAAG